MGGGRRRQDMPTHGDEKRSDPPTGYASRNRTSFQRLSGTTVLKGG